MRRDAKKDSNHNRIKEEVEEYGIVCIDTHQLGDGRPDMITIGSHAVTGDTLTLWPEIKTLTGTLTPDEEKFHGKYGEGAIRNSPIFEARTAWDILRRYGY